jgi:hypothetical protein
VNDDIHYGDVHDGDDDDDDGDDGDIFSDDVAQTMMYVILYYSFIIHVVFY